MAKPKLTIALITKNEAENLEACLRSVEWADEIVVVDSGSTDGTLEIARRFTDKIYIEADWPGFGPQRLRAQERATGDWIFAVDADERVTPELKQEILAALDIDDRSKVFAVPRLTWAFGSFIRHSGWYPDYVVRLYPRARARFDDAPVHEKVVTDAGMTTIRMRGDLLHFTFRDLEQWVAKTGRYAAAWSEERQKRGRKGSVGAGLGHAAAYFFKAYFVRRGFLDGRAGVVLAVLGAYSRFLKYTDLWLRSQPSRPQI